MLSSIPVSSAVWFVPLHALFSLAGTLLHLTLCTSQEKEHLPEGGVQDTGWKADPELCDSGIVVVTPSPMPLCCVSQLTTAPTAQINSVAISIKLYLQNKLWARLNL